jgi:hypothetical protein
MMNMNLIQDFFSCSNYTDHIDKYTSHQRRSQDFVLGCSSPPVPSRILPSPLFVSPPQHDER